MKIGIAQLNPTIGDLAGNAQRILEVANQAALAGVRLLLTPELSLCGYPPRDLLLQPDFIRAMAQELKQLARSLPQHLVVLVGTVTPNPKATELGGKSLFNSISLLLGGEVQQIFHKRLLPTYDVFDEDRYFEPGGEINHFFLMPTHVVELSDSEQQLTEEQPVHIGVTICEDLWNDEEFFGKRNYPDNPIADLAEIGVDLTINLSASPYTVGKQSIRESILKHSTVRYQHPAIYVNQVGGNDDLIFDGNSFVMSRQGELIGRASSFQPDLLIVKFDSATRMLHSCSTHQPIGQFFSSSLSALNTLAPRPTCEEEEIWSALVLGVWDYARKCGFTKAVLGLSGGIDSSLVAAIAVAALGAENVLGVLMPSPYSSGHSITDALALAQNLGMVTHKLPIGGLMQDYDQLLAELFSGTSSGIAEENIQSRIRGNLLMAIANKFGHLLLSTGNKSEMAVGYCTLYGDMNGGLAVIADVPKTKVYNLCRWINQQATIIFPHLAHHSTSQPIIPENVLTKAPSAELKPDQKDQDSLPPYEVLDDILDRLIHQHQALDDLVAVGHDRNIVQKVVKLITRAEFKRRQAPPGIKITDRAFGTGWRMPIARC